MNIERIRKADKDERFVALLEEFCGGKISDTLSTSVLVLDTQIALKHLQNVRFNVSPGFHVGIFGPGEKAEMERVVISESIDGKVITYQEQESYNAYEFINDYLGIESEEPMLISALHAKYPKLIRETDGSEFPWYDGIADALLSTAKRLA